MSDFISPFLEWLNANPHWAGFATFLISASESVAIIGTIVPGSITMAAIGTLAGAGVIPLWGTLIWAIMGAIVGDGISYWLGHYFKDGIRNMWPFKDNPGILEKGENFVHKYGVMSVFIGRFLGPVRALVPLVAGMLGMKPLQFTIANVASAIGWAPAYMLPGILLGAASLELPPDVALHVILVLFLLIFLIVLLVWVVYKILQLIRRQTDQLLLHVWNKIKTSRFHAATNILKHHNPNQLHGQLTLAFYLLLTTLFLISLIVYVKITGPQNILINGVLFHFFRGIRNPTMDHIMLNITLLGQKQVVIPVILALFCWLAYKKRVRVAFHALALGLLAGVTVIFIKHLVQSARPWGIVFSPETFSMPSGHTTLATTVYMGIAFILANNFSPKRRWLIYTPAAIIVFAIGMSRIYLGAHWFTDVLAAWLLSAAILMLIVLSFYRQFEKPVNLLGVSIVCLITLCLSYTAFHHFYFKRLNQDYAQLTWPLQNIAMKQWWEKDEAVPAARVNLLGFPTQNINIQWAGNLTKITQTLLASGWSTPPARDLISTFHRLANIKSTEYLPVVSSYYLDKKPKLILTKRNDNNRLLIIRLWESNRIIKETGTPLWVGTVGLTSGSYSWLFKHQHEIEVMPVLIFPHTYSNVWEWRIINLKLTLRSKKKINQKILLIREKPIKR